mmetsp:Transcript_13511/g.21086  ORF Transcript_13511/g.21086 Transcript_13511/m.21086 type:complete len:159 (+) Transcript_13511:585-1061(+)|eukprot:CAMPEP_0170510452 /NCGR_PEP_ID=MMETSP0208-20121228/65775_1 /TAXON_ID=197538 /ORGANISM="Strombidium inclinatum, Strain S3" /LENGTH=158 /DNA_ID=CAMNT_0010793917 /DNA_START=2827 /DNA_END=3303 /DNA_ORIENTATION=-
MVIIKRNDLVNELKHLISLEDQPTYSDARSSVNSKKNQSLEVDHPGIQVNPGDLESPQETGRPDEDEEQAVENYGPTLIDVIDADNCTEGESYDKAKKGRCLKKLKPTFIGQGDLGDFKFDEDKAQDLGETIVNYTLVITELVKELMKVKGFPGMRSP